MKHLINAGLLVTGVLGGLWNLLIFSQLPPSVLGGLELIDWIPVLIIICSFLFALGGGLRLVGVDISAKIISPLLLGALLLSALFMFVAVFGRYQLAGAFGSAVNSFLISMTAAILGALIPKKDDQKIIEL